MPAESEKAGPSYAECAETLQALVNSTEWPKQRAQYALALDCVRAMQMLAEGKVESVYTTAFCDIPDEKYFAFRASSDPNQPRAYGPTPLAAILAAGDEQ